MKKELIITKSKLKNKKYTAFLYIDGKYVRLWHFGAMGYEDFTTHRDPIRKKRYIARHSNEDYSQINPGSLSRYLLWEYPDSKKAIEAFENRFNVKITVQESLNK